jgi:hypothetical protein
MYLDIVLNYMFDTSISVVKYVIHELGILREVGEMGKRL